MGSSCCCSLVLLTIIVIASVGGVAAGANGPTPRPCQPRSGVALTAGITVGSAHVTSAAQCCAFCNNQTALHGKTGDCEAWTMTRDGVCVARQLSGSRATGVDSLYGTSWKRHSNFRGDCTPLWVNIAGPTIGSGGAAVPAAGGPESRPRPTLYTSGTQQQRDLACCQACTANPQCEAWAQATDWADADPGTGACFLRRLTKPASGAVTAILGAGYWDTDYPHKQPRPYFSERRPMVCPAIQPADRRPCGPLLNGRSVTTTAAECQSYGCCWDPSASVQCFTSPWRPVAIMHGMGSRLVEYEKNILWLRKTYPGIYVKNLNLYPGPPSMLTGMAPQLERAQLALAADPMLARGFNFYGESQGGLVARAYVSQYNDPPVHNLVAISGPQAGVGECPMLGGSSPLAKLCADLGSELVYGLPDCSFCNFWKGQDQATYLEKSKWLAKANNDGASKDPDKAARMRSLNFYMASAGSDDQVVQPRESAWHTFWAWGSARTQADVMPWNETASYKGDWLGIRSLDEAGKLEFNMYQGGHTKYTQQWWMSTVLSVFNNTLA